MLGKLKDSLARIKELEVKYNHQMKDYTSFKIGGKADIFTIPQTISALKNLVKTLKDYQLSFFILGRGSNIIVGDKGYRGVIIYTGELKKVTVNDNILKAETGISLASLANKALEAGLTGLEFASGIPGSLGGALYMNAGAYDGEMQDIIKEASLLDYSARKLVLKKGELGLSYRNSILQERPLIAVEVSLELKPGKMREIREKMKDLNQRRKENQPLEWPSAGSIFKRPIGYYAGPLIEEAGLKGFRVGDAQISEKHAGFIINLGNATAADVCELIKTVQETVYKKNGVKLEVEPRFIGEF